MRAARVARPVPSREALMVPLGVSLENAIMILPRGEPRSKRCIVPHPARGNVRRRRWMSDAGCNSRFSVAGLVWAAVRAASGRSGEASAPVTERFDLGVERPFAVLERPPGGGLVAWERPLPVVATPGPSLVACLRPPDGLPLCVRPWPGRGQPTRT